VQKKGYNKDGCKINKIEKRKPIEKTDKIKIDSFKKTNEIVKALA
jgi:hypothetical protein